MAKPKSPKVVEPKVTSDLSPIQMLALEKCIVELTDEQRGSVLSTDNAKVDMVVKISGSLKVGLLVKDAIQANRVPWEAMALVALSKLNAATLESVAEEAIAHMKALEAAADDKAKEALEDKFSHIKVAAKAVIDRLKGETKKDRFGAVTFKGKVEVATGGVYAESSDPTVLVKL